jgi:hypothetical protein
MRSRQPSLGFITDGDAPVGGLAIDVSGNLYGTTIYGGTYSTPNCGVGLCGTVFEITP